MNIHNFAVFDTETVGLPPKNLVYDLGLVICNRGGKILARKSWLIREIFTNGNLMLDAYFSRKTFSDYIPALDAQTMRLYSFVDARAEFNAMIAKHNAKTICAYNIAFDKKAIASTAKQVKHSGNFLHHKMYWCDLWLAACRIIANTNKYRDFCHANKFVSDAGNVRTNAEVIYAYIKQQPEFSESHTALADSIIETDILATINRRKKGLPRNEYNYMPWKIPQRKKVA